MILWVVVNSVNERDFNRERERERERGKGSKRERERERERDQANTQKCTKKRKLCLRVVPGAGRGEGGGTHWVGMSASRTSA